MSRIIDNSNEYSEKLVKLVPTEIIGAYIAIEGIVSTQPEMQSLVLTMGSITLLILVPLYLWFVFDIKSISQIAVTMFSFAVWVFSMGGPFDQFLWYSQVYGAVGLILWTITSHSPQKLVQI